MDEFHTQLRTAVLRTLSTDRQSPELARFAQEALDGRIDPRRVLGEASNQDFERDLITRIEYSGQALQQTDPDMLSQARQSIEDAYQQSIAPDSTETAPQPPQDDERQYWEDETTFAEFNEDPLEDGAW